MSNALGPVIGNRLAGANKAALKPHLRERLALLTSRSTPLGTVTTDTDGRLSFVPKDDPLRGWDRIEADPRPATCSAFKPGMRVRVHATLMQLLVQEVYPFTHDDAEAVMGCEGVVMEDTGCAALRLVVVSMPGEPWAFMPAFLQLVTAGEGDDERQAMTSGPAFDPYCEPLVVGDTVQGMDGRIGRVTLVKSHRLGVVYERGSAWCGDMNWRGSFRLLAKAPAWEAPAACPF
jgi:hypothetical protein